MSRAALRTLAREVRSEHARDQIPEGPLLQGGRVPFSGEWYEQRETRLRNVAIPVTGAGPATQFRGVVSLRRPWFQVGVGVLFPASMTAWPGGGVGQVAFNVRVFLETGKGRFQIALHTFDPFGFFPNGQVAFSGAVAGRISVDCDAVNTGAAVPPSDGLLVSAWGLNPFF
jgi:hypothetical protein